MFHEYLAFLKEKHLLRVINDRDSPQGPKIIFAGREFINFSSNDYLGLANHPYIINNVKTSLDIYGFGSGASRLLSGGSTLHKALENKVARFKGTESALVFNSGYTANIGIIPSLADRDTVIFSDEMNHASIIDGCRLSKAKTKVFRHKDVSHLEELMRKEKAKKRIVITETVFSMDGDIAPLREIYGVCHALNYEYAYRANAMEGGNPYPVLIYIDDAHGTGIIGNGRGALTHFNIKPEPWIIQMGTFSKALGSFGAFLAGSSETIQWALNNIRSFIYTTALPSCVIAASIAALELIESDTELIQKLWEKRKKTAKGIKSIGYDIMGSETPVIPIKTGNIENTLRTAKHLFEKGIYAPAIRPPTVKEPRIRISVSATHADEDIDSLIEALKDAHV